MNQESSLTAHPADVRKAQEVEGLGFAEAPLPVLLMGEPAKADQPGLVGMERETEFLKTDFNLAAEATGIVWVLEPHDDVIGIPYHHEYSPGVALTPLLHPKVKDVMQVNIGHERRDDRPLRGTDRAQHSMSVFIQHAGLQPLAQKAQETPILDTVL